MLTSPLLVSLTLFLSFPIILFLSPLLLSAPDADDLALFRRAAAPRTTSHLSSGAPKIAFLFLTNSNLTFSPLWHKFFNSNPKHRNLFNIYVHADPTVGIVRPDPLFSNSVFIPSKPTSRASPSLISAARRLLAVALLHDPLNHYFALLSQHCIPLHSLRFTHTFLFKHHPSHPSFIEILSRDPNLPTRYAARGDQTMLPEVPFSAFRVGSQFFVLTRSHARLVVRDTLLWNKFRLPCLTQQQPCYPEEHYFPTLLSMQDPNGCTGFTLTRVNWTGCWDGHPHLYTASEVSPQLIRRLRQSNSTYVYLFARKFAPECLHPLMLIADDVIFRD